MLVKLAPGLELAAVRQYTSPPFPSPLTHPAPVPATPRSLQIIGEQDMANIIRMQLAWMAPHTQVGRHAAYG